MSFWFILISKALRKSKVYHMDSTRIFLQTHEKVVWFDVSVNQELLAGIVHHLESINYLKEEHQSGMEAEFSTTRS